LEKQMIDKTALREALINDMVRNDYTRELATSSEERFGND
jgi:hypothetical protein